MRPSLSLIEESGRPTIVNFGKPDAVSASTRTRWASTPTTAAVSDVASMQDSLQEARVGEPCADSFTVGPRRVLGGPPPAAGKLAPGIDSQGVTGRDAGALQAVPRLEGADRRLEGARDRR